MENNGMLAILFDMNGVIIDDESLHEEAFSVTLNKNFSLSLNHKEYLKYFAGRTDKDGFILFLKEKQKIFNLDYLVKEKNTHYLTLCKKNIKSIPHVVQTIRAKQNTPFLFGLVTGALRNEAQLILAAVDIKTYF